ncbi:glycine cleavage T C-terminal barrel domain-containing protein [Brevibacterium aurantiacum]|uniref:Sarcosine oxidase subunit alpha n=3 Tax=Brevibacterium aurantiacum TaxID=273384 RepID=A0A1D7VYR0_BREAU|nr:glycine cleavage T C-terminal barrel domain-containing protein [Brevibacterium aurantiacum]AOP51844.1 Sarcosine oxidase alpha subunit [Brevibacterium aurantiacum]RCS98111.1 FAD-dependent oxidoreductase [Brevibacterium aurantiacum]GEB22206.1 sarcosine oxidase subunit alpha [Brevibacterium aurantiacum]SMX65595.1 sarcosine oxidase subunit alpha [Brevibacterium aurantiacum]
MTHSTHPSGSPRFDHATGIDRTRPVSFRVEGTQYSGFAGDTIASALIAAGRIDCGNSTYLGRARGVLSAGIEESNALVRVKGRIPGDVSESMLPATRVPITEGLEADYLAGLGILDPGQDGLVYEHKHVHTDVLVIGAGPAGLAAAREAGKTGARTLLLDDRAAPGGSLLSSSSETIDGVPASEWIASTVASFAEAEELTYRANTTVFGSYDSNYFVALEDRTLELVENGGESAQGSTRSRPGTRQRVWHIRAQQVVLATGAHERPIVFADNDRPGIMLASAVRTYLNRFGVAAGQSVAIAATNDSAYELLADLHAAGIEVPAIIDSRTTASAMAESVARDTGTRLILGSAVSDTAGEGPAGRISQVTVSGLDVDGVATGESEVIDVDLLAVAGGFSPVIHLHGQRKGPIEWRKDIAAFVPSRPVRDQFTVGAVNGDYSLEAALKQGAEAGHAAAKRTGFAGPLDIPAAEPMTYAPARPLWLVTSADDDHTALTTHFIDFQRDQSVADVQRAMDAGMRSVEHIKRYTSISTGGDQGKTSAVNAIGAIATVLGESDLGAVGHTTFRAPFAPVPFAALAGRRKGELFDPARITSIHPWHVDHGAEFEDVGQWKRPWYYPQDGEDMDAAVLRECKAVRESVGFQDASTLGKIEIRGTDAGAFLGQIYTNGFAKLKVGKGRYGLMCKPDGMVFDDGVTLRVADDRYYMTTTTGGAATVLEWLEEWHQTEWPELDVVFTSVTEEWSTVAVAGPKSREVIAKLAPHLDVSNEAFEFMGFRETTLAGGIPARICRISFSGELAFEINVENFYGLAVWEAVAEAGAEFDITPYGTETMHVLRAEKGFIIVGQDTDGTVTPQDAGMEWIVSKLKDFIGKRSYSRIDTAREDRKHLVGVLPVDGTTRLAEGAQLITSGTPITPEAGPVPMIGHVTSSYISPSMDRPFGLAMVENGRNRTGEIIQSPVGGTLVDVEITSPVFYDPEGNRRDG